MPDTQIQNQTNPNEGISNPPNGGQVDDVGVPNDNGASTVPESSAPNTPPQAVQSTPQATQVQQPTQPQQPDLSKAPKSAPAIGPTAPVAPPVPPQIQKASLFHDVAETLAGGPRYTYNVDAYGNMQRQKIPVSTAHLGLTIALEALSGGITGLANGQGPKWSSKSCCCWIQTRTGQVQQQDLQAKQQASQDFARRAQVTETNMRMYANARALGKQDAENIDSYIGQYKDLATKLQSEYPGYIKAIAKYSDLFKVQCNSRYRYTVYACTAFRFGWKTNQRSYYWCSSMGYGLYDFGP